MRVCSRPALLCALIGLSSCSELSPPEELLDFPIAWGIEIRVVDRGMFADGLSIPPDRTRADVYPHDTIEWRWYGAGPEGSVIDPPIWIAMSPGAVMYDLKSLADAELPACPEPLPLAPPMCRFGVGDRVQVKLGSQNELRSAEDDGRSIDPFFYEPLQVLAVASDGDIIDPETCLHLALSERHPDLTGCLFTRRTATVGPRGRLWAYLGFPEPLLGFVTELFAEPPNLNPVIETLELTRIGASGPRSELVHDSDTIAVRPGESLSLKLRLGAGDAQDYYQAYLGPGQVATLDPQVETLIVRGRFSAMVDAYEASQDGLEHSWVVDRSTVFYMEAGDERGGRAFATLRFVVDGDR